MKGFFDDLDEKVAKGKKCWSQTNHRRRGSSRFEHPKAARYTEYWPALSCRLCKYSSSFFVFHATKTFLAECPRLHATSEATLPSHSGNVGSTLQKSTKDANGKIYVTEKDYQDQIDQSILLSALTDLRMNPKTSFRRTSRKVWFRWRMKFGRNLCRFFSGFSGFPPSSKINFSKF